jgi:hypothetical protein
MGRSVKAAGVELFNYEQMLQRRKKLTSTQQISQRVPAQRKAPSPNNSSMQNTKPRKFGAFYWRLFVLRFIVLFKRFAQRNLERHKFNR